MKRRLLQAKKTVVVGEEVLARARRGLEAFGATDEALARLADFYGDTTIGPPSLRPPIRPKRSVVRLRNRLNALKLK
jgi:hypothetical protein